MSDKDDLVRRLDDLAEAMHECGWGHRADTATQAAARIESQLACIISAHETIDRQREQIAEMERAK